MRGLMKRLAALESVHAQRAQPQGISVAHCPFLPGEAYSVVLPESGERKEFPSEAGLFAFMNERGPWEGLLITPGLRSEEDWLAAAHAR